VRDPTGETPRTRHSVGGVDEVICGVSPSAVVAAPQGSELELELARQPNVIGIDERDVVADGVPQCHVAHHGRVPTVPLVHHPDARFARKRVQVLLGLRAGSVVDDDELPVGKGLDQDRLDGAAKEP
jgi:hypothetical protein